MWSCRSRITVAECHQPRRPFSGKCGLFALSSKSTGNETGGTLTTGTKFEYPGSRFSLVDHFNQQLETQGWNHEGDVDDTLSRTSVWSRDPDPKTKLNGRLLVKKEEGQQYYIEFNMERISIR